MFINQLRLIVVFAIVGIFIFLSMTGFSHGWSPYVRVSTESDGNNQHTSIKVDSEDIVHVAWSDYSYYDGCGGEGDIFYKYRAKDGSWSTTEVVSKDDSLPSFSPCLDVDSDGTVHIVWWDYHKEDSNILYSYKPKGGSWTKSEKVNTDSFERYISRPYLVVDTEDNVHFLWSENNNILDSGDDYDIFYKYISKGDGWSSVELVSSVSDSYSILPCLAFDSDDTIHVTWGDSCKYDNSDNVFDVFYRQKPKGGDWSETKIVSTVGTEVSKNSRFAIDSDDTVHMIWEDHNNYLDSYTDSDIFYIKRLKNGDWSPIDVVSKDSNTDSYNPSLTIDSSDKIHVMWMDGYSDCRVLYYLNKTKDGSWTKATNLLKPGSIMTSYQTIDVDSDGTLHMAWPYCENPPPKSLDIGSGRRIKVMDIYYSNNPFDGSHEINENVYWLAKAIMSEASIGTQEEQIAVGWTVLNRLNSNSFGNSIEDVVKNGFAWNQEPTEEIINLANDLLNGVYDDPTEGATYLFSPRSMPKEGDNTQGYDVDGVHIVPGTTDKVYFPSWAEPVEEIDEDTQFYQTTAQLEWRELDGIRNWYFMFYRESLSQDGTVENGTPDDGTITGTSTDGTPGFELILVVCAIALVLFWKRKRRLRG